MRKILLFALALVTVPSQAENWLLMVPVSYRSTLRFVDSESVLTKEGAVKVWIKTFNNQKIKPDESWLVLQRLSIDCNDRIFKIIESITYKSDGQMEPPLRNFPSNEIAPGSLADRIRSIICAPNFPTVQQLNDQKLLFLGNDINKKSPEIFDLMTH